MPHDPSVPVKEDASEFDEFRDAPVEIFTKDINLSGEPDEKIPNTIVINVIQARNLSTSSLRSTLSSYVKLTSMGKEYKTSVKSKTAEPYWNETFTFRALDWSSSVTLSVRDKINFKMRFVGQLRIIAADLLNIPGMTYQTWFRLRDINWEKPDHLEAEIELKVSLVYSSRNDPSLSQEELELQADKDENIGIIPDQEDETEEEAILRKKELELQEKQLKNNQFANLKQGEYQIQVHIIEARDLKGENLSGTSDPVCHVEVMGKKKKTSTKYDTLGCVFDEILFFHFQQVGKNELKNATLKISVFDDEMLMRSKLIGSYQLDLLSVYFRPHHELYRQWIALHDHLNQKDRGIQGFLLVSINVIGPGDTFHVHDREAEIAAAELNTSITTSAMPGNANAPSRDFQQALVLLPPSIDLKLHFLVVKVLKAEDLPAMDAPTILTPGGIDAFVQIAFGPHQRCQSSVVSVKGLSGALSPTFSEELWIPVLTPTLCRSICISVWDRDFGKKDDLVAVTFYDYQQVPEASNDAVSWMPTSPLSSTRLTNLLFDDEDEELESKVAQVNKDEGGDDLPRGLRWINLYGPPLKRVNKKKAKSMYELPETASTYRGRLLVSFETQKNPSVEEGEKFHLKELEARSWEIKTPKTLKYALRCAIFEGTELPLTSSSSFFPLSPSSSSTTKMRVTISIGSHELYFDSLVVKNGKATWKEIKEKWPIILPADLTQLPDIFVTLSRQLDKESFVSVAFARFPASQILQNGFEISTKKPPQWIALKEDQTRQHTRYAILRPQNTSALSAGSLLMKICFGREENAVKFPWDPKQLFENTLQATTPREFRIHLYQCRQLGLLVENLVATTKSNPNIFLKVNCCGQWKRTNIKFKTLEPFFYETLVFFVQVPSQIAFSPDLLIQVHESTITNVSNTDVNIPSSKCLGEIRIPMTQFVKSLPNANSPSPKWTVFQPANITTGSSNTLATSISTGSGTNADVPTPQLLCAVQYIDHKTPEHHLLAPPSIVPEYQEATIELFALGLRRLKVFSGLFGRNSVSNPFLEFELLGGAVFLDSTTIRKTKASHFPEGKNANFLETIKCQAKFPIEASLYVPQLMIRVCENSLAGFRRKILASCTIDLTKKLPWSSEYVPPQSENPLLKVNPTAEVQDKDKEKVKSNTASSGNKRGSIAATNKKTAKGSKSPVMTFSSDEEGDEEERPVPGIEVGIPDDPAAAGEEEDDDGFGVGKLTTALEPVAMFGGTIPKIGKIVDPAVMDQMKKEEQRRYKASQTDIYAVKRQVTSSITSANANVTNTDIALPPKHQATYMTGRDWWIAQEGEELEKYLQTKAFESYPLYRSVLVRPSLFRRKKLRVFLQAGLFKGLISIYESSKKNSKTSTKDLLDMASLQDAQSVEVRVYILKGANLQSKDLNGLSDPYLKLKLGKTRISDRSNHLKKTLNPEFFRSFVFHTKLPGPSQLELSVWDYDIIGGDDLIGSTIIDLEDRWFHKEWQKIGQPDECLKPIEYRHLYTLKNATSQGVLQVWIDILDSQRAAMKPAIEIKPPAPQKFEVRVIIWRAEGVKDKESSDINDYFVKAWMEGGKGVSTDVHWRCSNGKPCWNWRFKLPVEFPLRASEFGRLHLQLWDKDVLKWNDIIGEAQLDLYKWIRMAYQSNRIVAPFRELKEMAKTPIASIITCADGNTTHTQEDPDDKEQVEQSDADAPVDVELSGEDRLEKTAPDVADDNMKQWNKSEEGAPLLSRTSKATIGNKSKANKRTTGGFKLPMDPTPSFFKSKPKSKEASAAASKESAEAKAALNGLLDFMGLGNLPEDAEWITIYHTDRESATSMDMGRIGVSIQIVPEKEAQANPVGNGRDEPNMNPFLPPPVGRMRLTANPFMMLKELVGPKMCLRITIFLCCASCMMTVAVFGSTIMSTLTYIQAMRNSNSGYGQMMPNFEGEFPRLPKIPSNESSLTLGGNEH